MSYMKRGQEVNLACLLHSLSLKYVKLGLMIVATIHAQQAAEQPQSHPSTQLG